jgi:tRNA uridine 5-carboxymethylaminomethyl modification enzyme
MFTSRAEYRTILRQDNADVRLTPLAHSIGLASDERLALVNAKQEEVARVKKIMTEFRAEPEAFNEFLAIYNSSPLSEISKAIKVLLRPGIGIKEMMESVPDLKASIGECSPLVLEQVEIMAKYATYIEKEHEMVQKMSSLEDLSIPESFNYEKLTAMSIEARQKLMKIKPRTIGQASRISGVNPSDVQILIVYMGR